jgi:hypothetical protein
MTEKPALLTPDAARLPGLLTTGKRPDPLDKKQEEGQCGQVQSVAGSAK